MARHPALRDATHALTREQTPASLLSKAILTRHHHATDNMKGKRILSRLMFLVVGLSFVGFAFMGFLSRGFRTGVRGTSSGYVSAADQPVQFWTVIIVMMVLGLVALYCVFGKGKDDAS